MAAAAISSREVWLAVGASTASLRSAIEGMVFNETGFCSSFMNVTSWFATLSAAFFSWASRRDSE